MSLLLVLEAPSALSYTAGLCVMLAGVVGPVLYMVWKNRHPHAGSHESPSQQHYS